MNINVKKNRYWTICVGICFLFNSCNGVSTQVKLDIMYSTPVNLHLKQMECWQNDSLVKCRPWEKCQLKLCVYISPENCTSCYLKKMFQWEDFIKMEKDGKFFIYYIFTPQDGCEDNFHKYFYQSGLEHPFYIDKNKTFLVENPHIPQESMFHTFLLDEMNNILLVGDILHNTEIEQQFKKILDEHIKSKQ